MIWNLHGIIIEGLTNNATLERQWQRSFASLPPVAADPQLTCRLDVSSTMPEPPAREPQFSQGDLLRYYIEEDRIIVHFPRYGQLQVDLSEGRTDGRLVVVAIESYGVLEDMVAISLSPHLRRRGMFLIHAFAAAYQGKGVLLVGDIGAGKTTTGMALLAAGWRLLSNDSPIIHQDGTLRQYPGVLAAYPDTFAHFPRTRKSVLQGAAHQGRAKLSIAPESVWPDIWISQAPAASIIFPQIEDRAEHKLERLTSPHALARLLPHAVEQWDKAMIPRHLTLLRRLVEKAPAYLLRLGPDVTAIPAVIREALG